ncbi:MAG TPA: hypothetical protein ENG34_00015 [Candidatus Aenigmarchaeota archaeon]|nr:hypothetical protein [Candidatus Aenigmarchaeota archaeon]
MGLLVEVLTLVVDAFAFSLFSEVSKLFNFLYSSAVKAFLNLSNLILLSNFSSFFIKFTI